MNKFFLIIMLLGFGLCTQAQQEKSADDDDTLGKKDLRQESLLHASTKFQSNLVFQNIRRRNDI